MPRWEGHDKIAWTLCSLKKYLGWHSLLNMNAALLEICSFDSFTRILQFELLWRKRISGSNFTFLSDFPPVPSKTQGPGAVPHLQIISEFAKKGISCEKGPKRSITAGISNGFPDVSKNPQRRGRGRVCPVPIQEISLKLGAFGALGMLTAQADLGSPRGSPCVKRILSGFWMTARYWWSTVFGWWWSIRC